jgi:hypothetical protein
MERVRVIQDIVDGCEEFRDSLDCWLSLVAGKLTSVLPQPFDACMC